MKSVILRGWHLRIVKTVTQAHLQFSSSLRDGVEWGGGWERINSFSFFKENKQYKRMINNSAASLWKNISISTEKIICSRDLCFQVIMYLSMSSRRRGEARHRAGFWLFPKKLLSNSLPPGKNARSNIAEILRPGNDFWSRAPKKFKYPYPRDGKIIQMLYPRAKAIDQNPALCPAFPPSPQPAWHW